MRTAGRSGSGRLVGFALVAVALMVAPMLRADPVAAPAPGTLTVPRPDRPEATERREANQARILDARIEQMHVALQLTPTQGRLWPPVADAIRALGQARGRRFRQRIEAAASSIDGLEMQGDHMAKVGVAMSRLADATRPLIDSLTPQQKGQLPALMQRAPLRKVMARAFGVPAAAAAPSLSRTTTGDGMPAPPADIMRQPGKDSDDDE